LATNSSCIFMQTERLSRVEWKCNGMKTRGLWRWSHMNFLKCDIPQHNKTVHLIIFIYMYICIFILMKDWGEMSKCSWSQVLGSRLCSGNIGIAPGYCVYTERCRKTKNKKCPVHPLSIVFPLRVSVLCNIRNGVWIWLVRPRGNKLYGTFWGYKINSIHM
jgi:hypothetical protein